MSKGKRLLAILLATFMMLSAVPAAAAAEVFRTVKTYAARQFSDVEAGQWYEESVRKAYELGLMSGDINGTFRPSGEVTLAETVTVAARIHALATAGVENFVQGSPWYQVYVDYALQNGIISETMSDYNKAATRLEFAHIMAKALPAEELAAINYVEEGAIPDVADDQLVYLLYRAGVLTGSDSVGTFLPDNTIQRSEVAAIVTRMALPELRQSVSLSTEEVALHPSANEEERVEEDSRVIIRDNEDDEEKDNVQATVPVTPDYVDENNALTKPFDVVYPDLFASGDIVYSGENILIKLEDTPSGRLSGKLYDAGVIHLEKLYDLADAVWYKADIIGDVETVMAAVRAIDDVLVAEYDYAYEVESIEDSTSVSEAVTANQRVHEQWYLKSCGIQKSWEGDDKIPASHGEGIVVAVIDTGVDYTHEDLKDNIWVNIDEIPDNGFDDDNNGYIDDYYGVDIITGEGSGMDDHGHGTHAAGVIAAVNNNIGVVGVAYGAKIMNIKAGSSSGYFHQSDIAAAILYAHDNGADVINMSFGGSTVTIAVTDALEYAYTNCVLVASAGNEGTPNESYSNAKPNYPAALKYVLGVMSVNDNGVESLFTNYDVDLYSTAEYEVYAPGEDILSTIPGNRYASWDGTSMAAPIVSAMVAILRSTYQDRDTYPTKFIYGQIVNSGDRSAICCAPGIHGLHNSPKIVNVYEAVTKLPTPDVGVTDYRIFDSEELDPDNNGDGVIDAGETVALGFSVRNRWGMAENTQVTVDALSLTGNPNDYIRINNDTSATINYGSVGSYSDSDCGRILDEEGLFIGWENPFLLEISDDCPNDYVITLNINVQYENGLNPQDEVSYAAQPTTLDIAIRRGTILKGLIDENMVLTADNYYIIPNSLQIAKNTTVRVEPGTKIQFWTDDPNDSYADNYIAYLDVRGTLLLEGTEEEPIEIFPSELMNRYRVAIYESGNGLVKMEHTNIVNPYLDITYAENCEFTQNYRNQYLWYRSLSGATAIDLYDNITFFIEEAKECAFYRCGPGTTYSHYRDCSFYECVFVDCCLITSENSTNSVCFESCVFYGNNNYIGEESGDVSQKAQKVQDSIAITSLVDVATDPETGKVYLLVENEYPNMKQEYRKPTRGLQRFAEALGGTLACINSEHELEFLYNVFPYRLLGIGLSWDAERQKYVWADGSNVEEFFLDEESYLEPSTATYACWKKQSFSISDEHPRIIIELPAEYVTDIELERYEVTIDTETTWQIVSTVEPSEMVNAILLYESDNPAVADVDDVGLITGYSVGYAKIRVYSPDKKIWRELTVNVTDKVPLERIDLGENFRLNVEDVHQLMPVLTPDNTSQQRLYFESSDEKVATVSATGLITALTEGETIITAYSPYGIRDTVKVEVVIPAESITIKEPIVLFSQEGETIETDLGITVYPEDTTDQSLIWESANPEIAYMDENGFLVKGELGTTTLRATVNETDLYAEVIVCISDINAEVQVVQIERGYSVNGYGYMALLSDGTLWWWGKSITVPTRIEGFTNVKQFAYDGECSSGHLMVLTEDGVLNFYIENFVDMPSFDVNSPNNNILGYEPLTGVKQIACSCGKDATYYVLKEDGSVWGWGANSSGQLGTGSTANCNNTMVQVDLYGNLATKIVAAGNRVYILDTEGTVWRCGSGNTNAIEYETNALDIYTGAYKYPCAIETESEIIVKDGIAGSTTFTKNGIWNAAYDGRHAYIDENGDVFICGIYSSDNWYGELGIGHTSSDTKDYEQVLNVDNASAVFLTEDNSFFQTTDGKFYSVGRNDSNQLGNMTNADSSIPGRVYFGMTVDSEGPSYKSHYFENGHYVVDYDQALVASTNYATITLQNSDGTKLSVKKTIHLDKLYIEPLAGWSAGEQYTLTIPSCAFTNKFLVYSSSSITLQITVSASATGGGVADSEIIHPAIDDGLKTDESIIREEWTNERLMDEWEAFDDAGYNTSFWNNAILNRMVKDNKERWLRIKAPPVEEYTRISLGGNYWGTSSVALVNEQILDFDDFQTLADLNEGKFLTKAPEDVWPFVVDAGLIDSTGDETNEIGNDTVTFFVEFNRDMDISMALDVRFGSYYPYTDYHVEGEWENERRWVGSTTLTTLIENGYQYWSISNGQSVANENGEHLKFYEDWGRFSFKIDTTAAQAMILQGTATDTGIQLTWTQDDFDTLAGYNIYRAVSDEDAYYQRINTSIIPVGEEKFFDDTVLPGQIYYYKFTVVQTDLSESVSSGKTMIMSKDTMAPNLYHTPIYQAYAGNNLIIGAVSTDNLGRPSVILHYRTAGETEWTNAEMTALNDKYSAVISANKVTTAGIEYYITAFDGVSTTTRGTAAVPYVISVQEPLNQDSLGDVDDDGYITLLDALMVLQYKNGLITLSQEQFGRADLNGDKKLTAAEALKILRYANGEIGSVRS